MHACLSHESGMRRRTGTAPEALASTAHFNVMLRAGFGHRHRDCKPPDM